MECIPIVTTSHIPWLDYSPFGRPLDIEMFQFDDLRRRGSGPPIVERHRYGFNLLVCVTTGSVRQLIDFEPVECATGSFLVLRPGQVHSFGARDGWDGWLVFFRSEFLPSVSESAAELVPALGLDRLPNHLQLPAAEFEAVTEMLGRMLRDATSDVDPTRLHALLRYQLCALLVRLTILYDQQVMVDATHQGGLDRFIRFRKLLEEKHATWHRVAQYADSLGCTERTLTRAAFDASGRTAKQIIAQRIALEAKRLLAHTDRPIYLIAEVLGFDEATNFAKFFRHEAGVSPLEFRRQHLVNN